MTIDLDAVIRVQKPEHRRRQLTPRATGIISVADMPDARTWAEAGLLSGTVARMRGLQPHQRKEFLADALVFLCAARRGVPVITSDRDNYDFLQQLVPTGRFYAYT